MCGCCLRHSDGLLSLFAVGLDAVVFVGCLWVGVRFDLDRLCYSVVRLVVLFWFLDCWLIVCVVGFGVDVVGVYV